MFFGSTIREHCFNCSYDLMTGSPYDLNLLPSGVLRPIYFCGDHSKVEISER